MHEGAIRDLRGPATPLGCRRWRCPAEAEFSRFAPVRRWLRSWRDESERRTAGRGPAPSGDMPWAAVPPEVADLVRPGLPGVVEDIIAAVRAEVVEYDQPLEGEFGRLIREGATAALRSLSICLGAMSICLTMASMRRSVARSSARVVRSMRCSRRIASVPGWRGGPPWSSPGSTGLACAGRVRGGDLRLHRPPGRRRGVGLRARAVCARGLRAGAAACARRLLLRARYATPPPSSVPPSRRAGCCRHGLRWSRSATAIRCG